MFAKTPTEPSELSEVIDKLLREMKTHDSGSEEFAHMTDQLVKLYAIKDGQRPDRISRDVLANIAGSLAGILIIVGYERANVVASKALGFVMKLK